MSIGVLNNKFVFLNILKFTKVSLPFKTILRCFIFVKVNHNIFKKKYIYIQIRPSLTESGKRGTTEKFCGKIAHIFHDFSKNLCPKAEKEK